MRGFVQITTVDGINSDLFVLNICAVTPGGRKAGTEIRMANGDRYYASGNPANGIEDAIEDLFGPEPQFQPAVSGDPVDKGGGKAAAAGPPPAPEPAPAEATATLAAEAVKRGLRPRSKP